MDPFEKKEFEHKQESEHHKTHHVHHPTHHVEKKKSWDSFQKFMAVAAVVQVLLLVFIIYKIGSFGAVAVDNGEPAAVAPTPSAVPSAPTLNLVALEEEDDVKGDSDAPVTIVEFSDYECPFCGRYVSETYPQILKNYIETGKVKYIFRDFPLSFHPQAQKAAEAAECAGEQGKYFEMHDLLFGSGVGGGVASFKQYAADLGLNTVEFNDCLDSGEMAAEVQKDFNDGRVFGVQGTPAFFINGKLLTGAQPFEVFQQVIEQELDQ